MTQNFAKQTIWIIQIPWKEPTNSKRSSLLILRSDWLVSFDWNASVFYGVEGIKLIHLVDIDTSILLQ